MVANTKQRYDIVTGDYRFVYTSGGRVKVYDAAFNHNYICSFDPGDIDTQIDFEQAISWFLYENNGL